METKKSVVKEKKSKAPVTTEELLRNTDGTASVINTFDSKGKFKKAREIEFKPKTQKVEAQKTPTGVRQVLLAPALLGNAKVFDSYIKLNNAAGKKASPDFQEISPDEATFDDLTPTQKAALAKLILKKFGSKNPTKEDIDKYVTGFANMLKTQSGPKEKITEAVVESPTDPLTQITLGSIISYKGKDYEVKELPSDANGNRFVFSAPGEKVSTKMNAENLRKSLDGGTITVIPNTEENVNAKKLEVVDILKKNIANALGAIGKSGSAVETQTTSEENTETVTKKLDTDGGVLTYHNGKLESKTFTTGSTGYYIESGDPIPNSAFSKFRSKDGDIEYNDKGTVTYYKFANGNKESYDNSGVLTRREFSDGKIEVWDEGQLISVSRRSDNFPVPVPSNSPMYLQSISQDEHHTDQSDDAQWDFPDIRPSNHTMDWQPISQEPPHSDENLDQASGEDQKTEAVERLENVINTITERLAELDEEEAEEEREEQIEILEDKIWKAKKALKGAWFGKEAKKAEINSMETNLDKLVYPSKWFVLNKINRKNLVVMFGTEKISFTMVDAHLDHEGDATIDEQMSGIYEMPTKLITDARDNAVEYSLNGFYMRWNNKKEMQQVGALDIDSPDSRYDIVAPDGSYVLIGVNYERARSDLKERAKQYQAEQLEEFNRQNSI